MAKIPMLRRGSDIVWSSAMMRTPLAIAMTIVTVFGSAALAASNGARSTQRSDSAREAFGRAVDGPVVRAPNRTFVEPNSDALDSDVVISGGRVIGRDPDPNIRAQMRRDPVPNEY
jgi:hypothetical protein